MRRHAAGIAVAAALCGASVGAAPPTDVTIDGGRLRGVAADGVVAFKGIPFAAPPIGALRWRAPQPPAHWTGLRDASAYSHDCMQVPFPGDAAPLGTPPAEDCLYANVWRPAGRGMGLPVLVWIYGGGFVNGGASPPTYAGAALARQGIVVVSFNYRVGRFGTFAHPALTRADADHGLLGDYGYMDQIAALRWIRRNVAAFGGDPAKVTIVGESAGGFSVHNLLTSPLARGLFARAVIQSGGDGKSPKTTLADAEKVGVTFAAKQGIAAGDPQALARLRALSAEAVTDGLNMATQHRPGPVTVSTPFPVGTLSVDPAAAYASGAFSHVPVMLGATSADIGGPDGLMVGGARTVAGLLTDQGVPVYYYRFDYVADSLRRPSNKGANHASDIPYFLGTTAIKYGDATTAKDRRMTDEVSGYLVNFVKSGRPDSGGLAPWPRYRRDTARMMTFGPDATATVMRDGASTSKVLP